MSVSMSKLELPNMPNGVTGRWARDPFMTQSAHGPHDRLKENLIRFYALGVSCSLPSHCE